MNGGGASAVKTEVASRAAASNLISAGAKPQAASVVSWGQIAANDAIALSPEQGTKRNQQSAMMSASLMKRCASLDESIDDD